MRMVTKSNIETPDNTEAMVIENSLKYPNIAVITIMSKRIFLSKVLIFLFI